MSSGGRFVVHFEDRVVEGRYPAVEFPRRVVVTWGRHGSVRLPDAERELHAPGWAHYLPRLASAAGGATVEAHRVPRHLVEVAD
jgi:hypothetical protein